MSLVDIQQCWQVGIGPARALLTRDGPLSRTFVSDWNASSELGSRTCTVTRVSDGDTLTALCAGVGQRIRISSVDGPERRQAYGAEAKRFTTELTRDETVRIRVEDHDRYGRLVARVTLPGGRDLGRELVRAGLAWRYLKYSKDPELGTLEASARHRRRI